LLPVVAALALMVVLSVTAAAHGIFEKRLWNGKVNATTRGRAGRAATKLFMMQPHGFMTGKHDAIGWSITAQDQEARTTERVTLSYVKFLPDGKTPDTGATGTVLKSTFRLFGFGMKGPTAYNFFLTIPGPQEVPARIGIGIEFPAATSDWPGDGITVHGQLNLPNDSRRPRVLPPNDKQVWAWEMPQGTSKPVPLGGRTLDILDVAGQYIEPVLRIYTKSSAYGLGKEELFGPEALFQSAARGDEFGITASAGIYGSDGWLLLMASPKLLAKPVSLPWNTGCARVTKPCSFYLDLTPPWPAFLALAQIDPAGDAKVGTLPIAALPPKMRSFWMQALILNPFTFDFEVTDCVQLQGQ
jgi:hypothetical protein